MSMKTVNNRLLLFCCILDFGKGSQILELSKKLGAVGGTILLGRGTVKNEWLNILGVMETRKEIFIGIIDDDLEDVFYKKIVDKFSLEKRNHGIAFSMPLKYYLKPDSNKYVSSNESNNEKEGVNHMEHEAIFVIVDKDYPEEVLEAAEAAGSTGGTIIHGRGQCTNEKALLFDIKIEPEKVIILILSEKSKTDKIVNSIKNKLNMTEPNRGIIFVMDVSRTVGLYRGN